MLHNIYQNAKSFISINNQECGFLLNGCGLRQGDNISQILFSMYLNDLETYFEVERINGVTIDFNADDIAVYFKMYVILYADDTIIVSDNAESFQSCLDTFYAYCVDWKLTVNESKTKIIIFGARKTENLVLNLARQFLKLWRNTNT